MDELQIVVAIAAGVVLFLFGIERFSKEVQSITGEGFRRFLAKGTNNRFGGFALGAGVTAVIQSSTATSVIAVGLANAGVISFRQTLGVLFGANVGTTITAQLVALKLTDFAPALLLVGFVVGMLPFKWKILGRSIFYFGLVFFSLQLVSVAVEPLKDNPMLIETLSSFDSVWVGVLVGAAFTAIVQSSTVTTGVAIVLMSQGVLPLEAALPLLLGANVGTTVTALAASARMDTSAKRTAVSHILYNVGGALLFLPLIKPGAIGLQALELDGASALALAHLVFNLVTAGIFLALLKPFARLVERIVPDEADEVAKIVGLDPAVFARDDHGTSEVSQWAARVLRAQSKGYVAAVLAIETRDSSIDSRAKRLDAMVGYAIEEATSLVREVAEGEISAERSAAILRFVIAIDHVRQLQDSMADLRGIGARLDRQHGRLSIDALLEVQSVFPVYAKLFKTLADALCDDAQAPAQVTALLHQAQTDLEAAYRSFLTLVQTINERGELADFLSIHQRLRTKLEAFAIYAATNHTHSENNPLTQPTPEQNPIK